MRPGDPWDLLCRGNHHCVRLWLHFIDGCGGSFGRLLYTSDPDLRRAAMTTKRSPFFHGLAALVTGMVHGFKLTQRSH